MSSSASTSGLRSSARLLQASRREEVFKALKEGVEKAGLSDDEVRINRAGCMEHCEYGPTVVVYPEAVWYHVPSAEDAQEILREHVIGGKVVDRLLMDHII